MDASDSPREARIGDKDRIGMGIMTTVSVAPSVFLASTHFTVELVNAILLTHIISHPAPHLDKAQSLWSAGHNCQPLREFCLQAEVMGLCEDFFKCTIPIE